MRSIYFILIVGLSTLSCSKGSSEEKDTVNPTIQIATPLTGSIFAPGQSIRITGTITDDKYIAEVHIHVYNNNTGTLLMDVHQYPGSSNATFDQSITAVAGISYAIQVVAKDRAVNESNTTIYVSCN